jgi:hypothetical protein
LVLYGLFGGRYTNIDTNSFRHDLTLSEHVFGTVEGTRYGGKINQFTVRTERKNP